MNNKGQNLMEFLLIVALVVIVCIIALTALGGNVFTSFFNTSTKVKGFQPFGKESTVETKVTPGSLGGTYTSPQQQTIDGSTDIDFGSYVLAGIPADFSNFVEVSGTSGGTDLFAGLLEQLADQLEENGDTDGSSEFKKMAELVRMMADMQAQDEKVAKDCEASAGSTSGSDAHTCFQTYYNSNTAPELRDTLKDVLTGYNTNATDNDIIVHNDIGVAKHSQIDNIAKYNELKEIYPSYALVDTYESIMADSKYDDELKSLTTKIYQNLSDITTDHSVYSSNYGFGIWDLPTINYDPITGENNPPIDYGWDTYNSEGLSEIMSPTTSEETNIAAALLCTSSNNYLDGSACK